MATRWRWPPEGGNHIVSATNPAGGIRWQTIWSSDVTFGTITH